MPEYYVLECQYKPPVPPKRYARPYSLKVSAEVRSFRWSIGRIFLAQNKWENERPPKEPIEVATEPMPVERYGESNWGFYNELEWTPIPLFSRRLVDALIKGGVHNIQTYETILTNVEGDNPPPRDHYLAVNVIGLIDAADMEKSIISPGSKEELYTTDFDSLVIDPKKAMDILMFRLAQNTSAVLVHKRVKEYVDAAGIDTLTWFRPEEWAG